MALGPVQAYTGPNTKLGWTELYASDSLNRAFTGMPRGVYLGFVPSITGQVLNLGRDTVIVFDTLSGAFVVGDTVNGNASGATAVIRLVQLGLPGRGFLLVDSIVGVFTPGETISAPGPTAATLQSITSEDISLAKVLTTSPYGGGRTEEAITVVLGTDASLDFSPVSITDGTYYVKLVVDYVIGQQTVAQIISIKDEPPDHRLSVGICKVTKFGAALTLETIAPENRTDPYADSVTRIGFMPADAISDLSAALTTVQEVTASHFGFRGNDLGTFDPANPKTTGLPGRLNYDLASESMAARLGKNLVVVQGNDVALQSIPSATTINVSGSFAAKIRSIQPFRDVTNGDIPSGLSVPILIRPDGRPGQTLTISNASGGFSIGDKLTGAIGSGTAIIRGVSGDTIDIDDQGPSFYVGEEVESSGTTATVVSIDPREGAITEPETGVVVTDQNLVIILDTFTGKRPINSVGAPIYGRLLFGPSGSSGPGGGDPGELLVGTGAGEQLNFTNGSTAVAGNNIDFTEYFLPGDILEGDDGRFYEISPTAGSVQVSTLFLTSGSPYVGPNGSSGMGVGSGPRRRMRYLLKFVVSSGGVEADEVIGLGSIPTGASLRFFFPAWLDRSRSNYSAALSLRTTGDSYSVQPSGSVYPGLAYNASAGPSAQIIGAVKSWQVGGVDPGAGNYHTINYQTGTVVELSPGVVSINAVGPTGPPGGAGASPPGPQGPQGSGLDNIFASLVVKSFPIGAPPATDTFDFSPRRIRAYTITGGIGEANFAPTGGHIEEVQPTPIYDVDTTLTFEVISSGFTFATFKVYCAAATN